MNGRRAEAPASGSSISRWACGSILPGSSWPSWGDAGPAPPLSSECPPPHDASPCPTCLPPAPVYGPVPALGNARDPERAGSSSCPEWASEMVGGGETVRPSGGGWSEGSSGPGDGFRPGGHGDPDRRSSGLIHLLSSPPCSPLGIFFCGTRLYLFSLPLSLPLACAPPPPHPISIHPVSLAHRWVSVPHSLWVSVPPSPGLGPPSAPRSLPTSLFL